MLVAVRSRGDPTFAHGEMWVLAAESLTPTGMDDDLRGRLHAAGAPATWTARFDAALARMQRLAARLYAAAPEAWFAPRLVNVCVVREPRSTRPFFQPLAGSSWLVYASDFDPATGSVTSAAYALLFAERLGLVGDPALAHLHNASIWSLATEEEVADFVAGAERCVRPDAAAFRDVAAAVPWLRALHHQELRPPADASGYRRAGATGLLVDAQEGERVRVLAAALRADALGVAERYRAAQGDAGAGGDPACAGEGACHGAEAIGGVAAPPARKAAAGDAPAAALCAWLHETRPEVLVVDAAGQLLWRPDAADQLERLRTALAGIGSMPADSLRRDLETVGEHSARFLASLRWPHLLPAPDDLDEGGGTYVHPEHKRIAYSLQQPGLDPIGEAAPPFHRLLLGARVFHEWGHLVEQRRWIRVPAALRAEEAEARRAVRDAYRRILDDAPPELAAVAKEEAARLDPRAEPAWVFTEATLSRLGDYLANVVAARYASAEELDAYARCNARSHAGLGLMPFAQLARHAIEVQYLRVAGVARPIDYFLQTSWFPDYFEGPGLCSRAALVALVAAVERVCGAHQVDEEAFVSRPSSPAA
jgi:hypothetical protein